MPIRLLVYYYTTKHKCEIWRKPPAYMLNHAKLKATHICMFERQCVSFLYFFFEILCLLLCSKSQMYNSQKLFHQFNFNPLVNWNLFERIRFKSVYVGYYGRVMVKVRMKFNYKRQNITLIDIFEIHTHMLQIRFSTNHFP